MKIENNKLIEVEDEDIENGTCVIPLGVTSIGKKTFAGCTSLEKITIPDSVRSIGDNAFEYCRFLEKIIIPDSVKIIGYKAFYACRSLKKIIIPDSVQSIGGGSFTLCLSLEGITIPNGVKSIEDATFSHCDSLKSITIPNSVTNIDNYAFSNCSSLESITIPSSVRNIGNYVFKYCNSLKKVILPEKVEMGKDVFKGCPKDIKFIVNDDDLNKDNVPYNFDIKDVGEEDIIKDCIESDIPVFLHGKSSEGKSARVKEIDKDCTIIYLRNSTPDSLNGKSIKSDNDKMIDIKPTWLEKLEEKCKKEPEKLHILFFDEITNALPSIQGMAFNIVLDREVNGKFKLPSNVRIVAAGNEMEDSLSANNIAEPLFNRFAHVYIKTTVDNWIIWASKNKIHPSIISYIAYKKEKALRSKYTGVTPNADPRKWEMASKILYKTGKVESIRSLVGEEITKEFKRFISLNVITLEDVINENYNKEEVKTLNTDLKYSIVIGLVGVDIENVEKVRDFINLMGKEYTSIFDNIWVIDEERLEKIAELKFKNKTKEKVLTKNLS